MRDTQAIGFELSTSGRDDGTVEAVYIQIMDEPVAQTKEIMRDILLADYAADGRIVGIEVLAPVKFSDLDRLIEEQGLRASFRRFVEGSAPRAMVTA
jgi:uncharacterized protein YuzE